MCESAEQATCVRCGSQLSQPKPAPPKASLKSHRPVLFFTLATILICSLLLAFIGNKRYNALEEPTNYDALTPVISLTANNLTYIYETNEIRADEMYQGKLIEVSGVVERVSKGVFNTVTVSLKGSTVDEQAKIDCYFDEKNRSVLAQLRPGQVVFIRGTCDGKAGKITLKDCAIKSPATSVTSR